ncbi:MAG: indole-3-glycerol phosphate synthase TrpC [Gemmatimonadetes bacterium]|nr:indole-3-glycerol phosphate synthase TrpC [Gemmatimonadota bacterium]MYG84989.1 indole-3-glycerol phosphate synthase TrpC [Gemmatimonadota bacterium]MYJ90469.1 indole-3-glycerol phosphate synthase TrpC [Gemmatimonadota bacterium]
MNILDRIVAHKIEEVEDRKRRVPLPEGEPVRRRDIRPFDRALKQGDGIGVIAEFKKASPSKGAIRPDASPAEIGPVFAAHGASAISVLTDRRFFQGSDEDLAVLRRCVPVPVLRKEFIVDEYQVHETAALGADAMLLIAAILDDARLAALQRTAAACGLHCLVEVHNEEELDRALAAGSRIIGINNRDLTDFTVSLETSLRLRPRIPRGIVTVSESGIHGREDVLRLQEAGFDAVLVGESLMGAEEIGGKLDALLGRSGTRQQQGIRSQQQGIRR